MFSIADILDLFDNLDEARQGLKKMGFEKEAKNIKRMMKSLNQDFDKIYQETFKEVDSLDV